MLFSLLTLALAAAPPTPPDQPPRVLVLSLQTVSVEPATTASLGGVLAAALAADERLAVIAAADVADLAALEAEKQSSGCDSNGCFAEIADALGARYVVIGDVNRLGDAFVLNLRLLDTATGNAPWRLSLQEGSLEKLSERVRPQLRRIGDALVIDTAAAVAAAPSSSVTGLALVGGGVAIGLGALLGDVFSPTSSNSRIDAVDWVLPAGYVVVAPALIIVGGILAVANAGASP
jgi:TolB-like protein